MFIKAIKAHIIVSFMLHSNYHSKTIDMLLNSFSFSIHVLNVCSKGQVMGHFITASSLFYHKNFKSYKLFNMITPHDTLKGKTIPILKFSM